MMMTGKNRSKKKGRPIASPQPRDNSVTFRLNSTEFAALQGYVERYDTSISDVLRDVLMIMSIIPE